MPFAAPPLPHHSGSEPPATGITNKPVTGSLSARYELGRGSHINHPS